MIIMNMMMPTINMIMNMMIANDVKDKDNDSNGDMVVVIVIMMMIVLVMI